MLRTFTCRTGGDLSQDARSGDDTWAYSYNARKRLVVWKKNGTDAGYYGYDYQGHRVWRTVFGTSTVQSHYVYDLQGHLIAEHDGATGAVVREYVWLDDTPVAMIDSSSGTAQTYYIHTGQIEEPLVMTDASKAKVWDGYVEPYGQAQVFGTPSAGLDLRLPGQFYEAETGGLNQNWNRNYDPSLGRYAQVDPLGIDVGQDPYMYVNGRPLEFTDPNGKFLVGLAGAGIGGIVGGGTNLGTQLIQNHGDWSKVNWSNVGWSAGTGALQGFLMTTPLGLDIWATMAIGAGTNLLNYALTTPVPYDCCPPGKCWTLEGAGWAVGTGALGAWLGGTAPNPYMFIKPSPFLNDLGLVTKMVSPKVMVTNLLGSTVSNVPQPQ